MTKNIPRRLEIWIQAARPKTLWAAVSPVIVGGAFALDANAFHLPTFIIILSAALLLQIGANFANDLFDFLKSTDTEERLGPLRVTQAGLVSPEQMKNATALAFLAAVFLGYFLVMRAGLPVVLIGLSGVLFGILYTAGPVPLGYIGMADLFVFLYFGPVATAGTFYVLSLSCSQDAAIAGVAMGLLSMAILTVNNLRDMETDMKSGKKTLAVRFGKTFAKVEYLLCIAAALLIIPIYLSLTRNEHPFVFLGMLAFFPAVSAIHKVFTVEGRPLNQVLAETSRITLIYAILLSAGWML